MDESSKAIFINDEEHVKIPESPKPLAFTIDFGDGKIDAQRHKSLVEKLRHRRGQSMTKIEGSVTVPIKNKNSCIRNLPHKSSVLSEKSFSSDEKTSEPVISMKSTTDTLNSFTDCHISNTMTQSSILPFVANPQVDLTDICSPTTKSSILVSNTYLLDNDKINDCTNLQSDSTNLGECDVDKSDTISDTGTYTLDADNYSEEQKARMSIDKEFKLEEISVFKKTEDYVRSLLNDTKAKVEINENDDSSYDNTTRLVPVIKPQSLNLSSNPQRVIRKLDKTHKALSPILSPTQHFSVTQNCESKQEHNLNNEESQVKNIFNQIMFSNPIEKASIKSEAIDQGNIISVTSSGAFRPKSEKKIKNVNNFSLSQSGVQIEAYTENKYQNEIVVHAALTLNKTSSANLSANVIHVSDNLSKVHNDVQFSDKFINSCETLIKNAANTGKESNLSTGITGWKTSPTKIPSPLHSSKPRSRNSSTQVNTDLSDSSLETDSYLKPTQNIINSLQYRLSIDSDHELNTKYLNNDARNLLKKPSHLRHNSFDDRTLKISNKLEHFQNKNLQTIDQTYANVLNQYKTNKIQNSPNNSPIRRSSSFSTKNQNTKNLNFLLKEVNIVHSPSLNRNSTPIQRSASSTSIKPTYLQTRRSSISVDHHKIDRNVFGDTESSSEEDFDKNVKKKGVTNTRYNRAFSLRRARAESDAMHPKCPNTPEMRRKFQSSEIRPERAISVDRKPIKTNEVQSRYLQNITKKSSSMKCDLPKHMPTISNTNNKSSTTKLQAFSRTDTGRFSMRSSNHTARNLRKDYSDKKQPGGRSNSSLSSKEVEFQNWKRRKSYDPMKAAAEGKRKAELAKRQSSLTQSPTDVNQDCDSSPSHSSSVHRSQSFHGTATLQQLISSDEDDQTLSVDEGFSPPTPSPCELSPARGSLKYAWRD